VECSRYPASEVTIEEEKKPSESTGPEILRYPPHTRISNEYAIDVKVERTNKASLTAKIGGNGVEGSAGSGTAKVVTESYQRRYFESCRANQRPRPGSNTPIAVEWVNRGSSQPHAKDDMGLCSEIRFAVLLQRNDDSKFTVTLKSSAYGGKRDLFRKCWESLDSAKDVEENARKISDCARNRGRESVTVKLDPQGLKYMGKFKGIKRNKLAEFADDDAALVKLTEV
jgi:hypothetical protein